MKRLDNCSNYKKKGTACLLAAAAACLLVGALCVGTGGGPKPACAAPLQTPAAQAAILARGLRAC
jgi:hypothetical protein